MNTCFYEEVQGQKIISLPSVTYLAIPVLHFSRLSSIKNLSANMPYSLVSNIYVRY